MRIEELIEELQDLAEQYPDAEVRIAHQPSWPLQYTISEVVASEGNYDEEDGYDEEQTEDDVIYIAEGSQVRDNPYLPSSVSYELGWK